MSIKEKLTLQVFFAGQWHDAGKLTFHDPAQGLLGDIEFSYDTGYVDRAFDLRGSMPEDESFCDERAFGINLPGQFGADYRCEGVNAVLRDLIDQGAGRRWLMHRLRIPARAEQSVDVKLLREGCVAPPGNLRIKEAWEAFSHRVSQQGRTPFFTEHDIARHGAEVISHANDHGMEMGGCMCAGGDASKLLLGEDARGHFYPEGTMDETRIVRHWMVKFPRGRRSRRDCDVLRGEASVYQALSDAGVNTIHHLRLVEGPHYPALWLERFDRAKSGSQTKRFGLESVYSLMGRIGDGERLYHDDVLLKLNEVIGDDSAVVEYVLRDVINWCIGNVDNHGRNIALIKIEGCLQLAPAFDLAPMVMDPEGIARRSVWNEDWCSAQTEPDYGLVLDTFCRHPVQARKAFQDKLSLLVDLEKRLSFFGAPRSMLAHPRVKPHFAASVLDRI